MADLKMMLQNLRDKSKCCKKDDFTGERYTIIHDMSIETLNMICDDGIEQLENAQTANRWIPHSEQMPELIDRAALIAEYDRVHVGAPGGARKLMVDAPAVNRWIPCCESLPEDGEEVLCYSSDWGAVVTYRDRFDLIHVTHWMPLPSPPEVRQNDT